MSIGVRSVLVALAVSQVCLSTTASGNPLPEEAAIRATAEVAIRAAAEDALRAVLDAEASEEEGADAGGAPNTPQEEEHGPDHDVWDASPELEVDVRVPRGASAIMNSVTFGPNVLQGKGAPADHWVVFFCYSWYEACQATQQYYRTLATKLDRERNRAVLMSSTVRFAEVDCASERELCNEQKADQYPMIVHYTGGERSKAWTGSSKDKGAAEWAEKLNKWLQKRLVNKGPAEAVTKEPEVSLAKAAVMFALVATMVGALMGHCVTLWDAIVELRRRKAAGDGPEKRVAVEEEPAPALGGGRGSRLRRCLPREWAQARSSLEL